MPEGDTIYRTAVRLREVLAGRQITRVDGRGPALEARSLTGRTVQAITTRGKHLLIHTDQSLVVHTHLGMWGAWHIYRPGQPWSKPAHQAALLLETADALCVCFLPKTLQILSETALRRHPHIQRLGPDILHQPLEEAEIVGRLHQHHLTAIGQAVMNQTIVCGIGNIYKSELLFLTRTNPFVAVGQLSDEALRNFVRTAHQLMTKNLQGYPRRTRMGPDGSRVWVYRRGGQPCFVCGQPILVSRQGDLGRSTYWCASCQPKRGGSPLLPQDG